MEASALTHASRRGLLARPAPFLRLQKDGRLVALIREGQDRAFEVLFNRYHTRLLAFCQHMLSCREDAEDVLQEVFVAAHNAMLADDRDINVRPWLYRIARNRCLNHLRRPVPEGQDSMDVHPHENGATTLERVQNREEFRQLISDVRTLPETQRTALLLREIDALSYEEIAQAMNNTVPSVKSLLVRARITLAEASQARLLTCGEVQVELAEVAEGLRKASGPVRHHLRDCDECREFRSQLRSNSRALAAILPIGPLAALKGLLAAKFGGAAGGGASSAAGGAAGGAAAGPTAAGAGAALGGASAAGGTAGGIGGAIGGALGAKAAAGVATAALLTAGAVEVKHYVAPQPVQEPAAERVQAQPRPHPVPERGPQPLAASNEDPAPQSTPADESVQPEQQLPAEQQDPVEQPPAPAVPADTGADTAEDEAPTTEPSVTGTGTETGEGTVPTVETGGTPPVPGVPTDPIPVQPSH
jgi:RNA polymerase sigma factor (sigma-70 family)